MNMIERYLQAQSRTEMLARYILFSSTKRKDQAYADSTASLVLPAARVRIQRDELVDEALGPQNVPERSTACQLFSQRDLGKER